MPNRMPEYMSDRLPQYMSGRMVGKMSEDLSKYMWWNVIAGITGSKAISMIDHQVSEYPIFRQPLIKEQFSKRRLLFNVTVLASLTNPVQRLALKSINHMTLMPEETGHYCELHAQLFLEAVDRHSGRRIGCRLEQGQWRIRWLIRFYLFWGHQLSAPAMQ